MFYIEALINGFCSVFTYSNYTLFQVTLHFACNICQSTFTYTRTGFQLL